MGLRHKGLAFEKEVPPNLGAGENNAGFRAANPRMEVPALVVDREFKIFDSTAIMMYLEDAFPSTPALLPADPRLRAEARMIEEVCDTHYEAINWALGEINWFHRASGAEADRLKAAAREQTHQILAWLSARLGDKSFFNGETVGYADYCVAPILNRSVMVGNGPAAGSSLLAYYERVKVVPWVAETFREVDKAAPGMAAMGPAAFAKGSGRKREYRDHRLEFLVKNGAIGIVQKGIEEDTIRFSWPQPKI
jgi:RNA polymerase-associated protein